MHRPVRGRLPRAWRVPPAMAVGHRALPHLRPGRRCARLHGRERPRLRSLAVQRPRGRQPHEPVPLQPGRELDRDARCPQAPQPHRGRAARRHLAHHRQQRPHLRCPVQRLQLRSQPRQWRGFPPLRPGARGRACRARVPLREVLTAMAAGRLRAVQPHAAGRGLPRRAQHPVGPPERCPCDGLLHRARGHRCAARDALDGAGNLPRARPGRQRALHPPGALRAEARAARGAPPAGA